MTTIKNALDPTVQKYVKTLPKSSQIVAKYINLEESNGSLAHLRFAQDTLTNLMPKAIMSRSLADLADTSFLEISESLLVYYGPKLLGENLFRKIYSKKLSPELSKQIPVRAEDLINNKTLKQADSKKLMPIKAAIAVSTMAIPLLEYCLNYVKNLFTLKLFKQADFNNIANLNKNKTENNESQKKVKESAIKHLKIAGSIFAGCLGFSALLATKGKNSKILQKISETILAPGNKIFKNDAKKAAKFNEYMSIDFANDNGKLGLSKGQIVSCVLIGGAGYFGAAKDRGKQNFLEVLFRYPIVTFYVITGADLFKTGFKKILNTTGNCKELLQEERSNSKMPKLKELPILAEKLAKKNGTSVEDEFKKLFKQKSLITAVPTLFGLLVMGFFVAGTSRLFTQYRYDKEKGLQNKLNNVKSN